MRDAGICLMAAALGVGGFYASWILRERLEVLMIFRQMISHLKGHICYRNDTLADALSAAGSHFQKQNKKQAEIPVKFFLRVANRMEDERNRTFEEIWKEEMTKIPEELLPMGKERRNLAELGDHLGYADQMMQEQTLLFYLEHADESIAIQKKDLEEKRKLYRTLGLAGGFCLVIILI